MSFQTILVVDDEPAVRTLVRSLLEREGFTILAASSGAEAIALFKRHATTVTLLVTDVVMPGMTGPELAQALLQVQPNLQVLYVSGFCDDQKDSMQGFRCVAKPFRVEELVAAVCEFFAEPDKKPLHRAAAGRKESLFTESRSSQLRPS